MSYKDLKIPLWLVALGKGPTHLHPKRQENAYFERFNVWLSLMTCYCSRTFRTAVEALRESDLLPSKTEFEWLSNLSTCLKISKPSGVLPKEYCPLIVKKSDAGLRQGDSRIRHRPNPVSKYQKFVALHPFEVRSLAEIRLPDQFLFYTVISLLHRKPKPYPRFAVTTRYRGERKHFLIGTQLIRIRVSATPQIDFD